MPEYKVKALTQVDAGEGKSGSWTKQKVTLVNSDGREKDVLLFCNQYAPVPAEGSTIEGRVGEPYRPGMLPEFERARKGGRNGSSGAPKDFKADPVKQAAIACESAQKGAIEIMRLALENDVYAKDELSLDELTATVKRTASALLEQIQQAMGEAK